VYLHLRFLKDGVDFASAYLSSKQRGGQVLGAVTLVTDGGDTHVSINRVQGGRVRAKDLRVRFEVGGDAGVVRGLEVGAEGGRAWVEGAGVRVGIGVAHARLGKEEGRLVVGGAPAQGLRWVDVELLSAPQPRELDLAALEEACVAFALQVGRWV
jgi:hypothetical protein